MAPSTRTRLPLLCALFALAFSVALNIVIISVIRRNATPGKVDDSKYSDYLPQHYLSCSMDN